MVPPLLTDLRSNAAIDAMPIEWTRTKSAEALAKE